VRKSTKFFVQGVGLMLLGWMAGTLLSVKYASGTGSLAYVLTMLSLLPGIVYIYSKAGTAIYYAIKNAHNSRIKLYLALFAGSIAISHVIGGIYCYDTINPLLWFERGDSEAWVLSHIREMRDWIAISSGAVALLTATGMDLLENVGKEKEEKLSQ
jgi:hypothetical protein